MYPCLQTPKQSSFPTSRRHVPCAWHVCSHATLESTHVPLTRCLIFAKPLRLGFLDRKSSAVYIVPNIMAVGYLLPDRQSYLCVFAFLTHIIMYTIHT